MQREPGTKVTPNERANVISLREKDGFNYNQISNRTGIAYATVKKICLDHTSNKRTKYRKDPHMIEVLGPAFLQPFTMKRAD